MVSRQTLDQREEIDTWINICSVWPVWHNEWLQHKYDNDRARLQHNSPPRTTRLLQW